MLKNNKRQIGHLTYLTRQPAQRQSPSMSRLHDLFDQPEPPEGFVWFLPGDGSSPIIVANENLTEDSTLELLWSDELTDSELALLAAHGSEPLANAANNALAARFLRGEGDDA
jgi:hypothetical protein